MLLSKYVLLTSLIDFIKANMPLGLNGLVLNSNRIEFTNSPMSQILKNEPELYLIVSMRDFDAIPSEQTAGGCYKFLRGLLTVQIISPKNNGIDKQGLAAKHIMNILDGQKIESLKLNYRATNEGYEPATSNKFVLNVTFDYSYEGLTE